jgi:hypothetical protein
MHMDCILIFIDILDATSILDIARAHLNGGGVAVPNAPGPVLPASAPTRNAPNIHAPAPVLPAPNIHSPAPEISPAPNISAQALPSRPSSVASTATVFPEPGTNSSL